MALRGSDRVDGVELESRGVEVVRTRRPWALIIAALLLVVLSVVLGVVPALLLTWMEPSVTALVDSLMY